MSLPPQYLATTLVPEASDQAGSSESIKLIVLPRQSVQVGHLPYELHCDPNSTTLPMHSTPGIGTSSIETHSADSFASTQLSRQFLVYHHSLLVVKVTSFMVM